ncbi:hypothetical protein [Clostridium sp.]|uniref:hypothetical protein n=1 Tax=Clostridium sp. TaxID=1506 RepID=UPI003D6CDAE5
MDIAALSKVQQRADIVEIKSPMDLQKENANPNIERIRNVAIDSNLGQKLDAIADNQMDKKEELHRKLQQEIKWAKEKQILLNLKEVKLLQMREIAEQGKQAVVTPLQLRNLNHRLDKLAAQVSAIDSDSRRTKDGEKLE